MSMLRRVIGQLAHGGFVSGEDMATCLGVSRAAVNQYIARLREQGVSVHSVRGRGYRLPCAIELLDADDILNHLEGPATARIRAVDVQEETDSTNRRLRELISAEQPVDACLAEHQTAGRGRRGRNWLAAPYTGILLSLSHQLPGGPAASSGLSLAAGVAVARAVVPCGGVDVRLKWPNDLILAGAKFGGILVEIAGELGEQCHCVIGVGLNVYAAPKLPDSESRAVTCLQDHASLPVSRNQLAGRLLSCLVEVLEEFNRSGFGPFRAEWEALHAYRDQLVTVVLGNDIIKGVARSVGDDGALWIEEPTGRMRQITTGDVMA